MKSLSTIGLCRRRSHTEGEKAGTHQPNFYCVFVFPISHLLKLLLAFCLVAEKVQWNRKENKISKFLDVRGDLKIGFIVGSSELFSWNWIWMCKNLGSKLWELGSQLFVWNRVGYWIEVNGLVLEMSFFEILISQLGMQSCSVFN